MRGTGARLPGPEKRTNTKPRYGVTPVMARGLRFGPVMTAAPHTIDATPAPWPLTMFWLVFFLVAFSSLIANLLCLG